MKKVTPAYSVMLVGLLSLNFGIVFFDRNALNFLMPFVREDIVLSNTQIGMLASALSLTWALSGIFISSASDRSGRRKTFLVLATVCFSLCSFLTGIAPSFLLLLGARLLMGAAEGAILPISQSIIASVVPAHRRGVAMGITQNFGSNLLGSFVAPVALVALASWIGWRYAFFVAGIPGLITAFFIWRVLDDDPPRAAQGSSDTPATTSTHLSWGQALGQRNILLCAIIAILLVSFLVITWAFMPLFLTEQKGFEKETMGWLMGVLGLSATLSSFIVPGISDRVGRKPIMILMPIIGLLLPLGAIYLGGSAWLLAMVFLMGWGLNGCFPLFMSTIPSETVDARHVATALGLVMGIGEVIGGVAAPFIAGILADIYGLTAPLWMLVVLAILATLTALGLKETAPFRQHTSVDQQSQGTAATATE